MLWIIITRNGKVSSESFLEISKEKKKQIQEALNFFDFQVGEPDGIFGKKTLNALRQFSSYADVLFNPNEISLPGLEFLLSQYIEFKKTKVSSSCDELERKVPRTLLM